MIDVAEITGLQQDTVKRWHERDEPDNPYRGFLNLVCQQHTKNYLLWHQEDIARSPDVGDAKIAQVKRNIDGYNQARNDLIEQIDVVLLGGLKDMGIQPPPHARLNTETPGSVIDRLSILAIRIYHMHEQVDRQDADPSHRERAQERLGVCLEQHRDLSGALAELLGDILAGRKRLKVYRQFKMYNDPTMNPWLYGRSPGQQKVA